MSLSKNIRPDVAQKTIFTINRGECQKGGSGSEVERNHKGGRWRENPRMTQCYLNYVRGPQGDGGRRAGGEGEGRETQRNTEHHYVTQHNTT